MPIPRLRTSLPKPLGVHEGLSLTDDRPFLTVLENMYLDRFGRIAKNRGYAQLTTVAVGGTEKACLVSAWEYKGADGINQIVWLLNDFGTNPGANAGIYSQATPDAALVSELAVASTAVGRAAFVSDAAQYKETMIILVPEELGSLGATINTYDGATAAALSLAQSPQPTAAAGAVGNPAGTYEFKLVSVETDGSRHPGSDPSTEVQLTGEQADLSWTADADTDVVGYEVYATSGTGLEFYFVDYVDGRTTVAFTYDLTDEELVERPPLKAHGESPPTTRHIEVFQQRTWYGRSFNNPLRVWFSDPNEPLSCRVDNNYVDIGFEASDDSASNHRGGGITALKKLLGSLYVFTPESIWRIYGTGIQRGLVVDWNVEKTRALMGVISHKAIVQVPPGARFYDSDGSPQVLGQPTLVYITSYGDIRAFDGAVEHVVSSAVSHTVPRMAAPADSAGSAVLPTGLFTIHDKDRSRILFFFEKATADDPEELPEEPKTAIGSGTDDNPAVADHVVIWDYETGAMSTQAFTFVSTTLGISCGVYYQTRAGGGRVILGTQGNSISGDDAEVLEYWSGADYNGTDFVGTARWRPFFGTNEEGAALRGTKKRWRTLETIMVGNGVSRAVRFRFFKDFDLSGVDLTLDTFATGTSETGTQDRDELLDSNGDHLVSEAITVELADGGDNDLSDASNFATTGTAWLGAGGFTITTATSVIEGETAYQHENSGAATNLNRNRVLSTLSGNDETFSIVVENVDAATSAFGIRDSTAAAWVVLATFTWSTGAIAVTDGAGTLAAEDLGGGRWRLSATGSGTLGNNRQLFIYPTGTTQNTETAIIHHAQFNEASAAEPFLPIRFALEEATLEYQPQPDEYYP